MAMSNKTPSATGMRIANKITGGNKIHIQGEGWCDTEEIAAIVDKEIQPLVEALEKLAYAADAHIADQCGATDSRCGLTQPITVAEGQALVDAHKQAFELLAAHRGEKGNDKCATY
jgi:hypothetical protein